jgi:hypothetical protein
MNSPNRRRCRHCRQHFDPDYRNAYHQRFCSTPACQHASKQASQRRWLRKPVNRDYFCGPSNVLRVQTWRGAHPDYWRSATRRCHQVPNNAPAPTPGSAPTALPQPPAGTLQEFCRSKMTVLTELVARLSGYALQEDIGRWASEVVTEAQCILERCQLKIISRGQLELPINYHESG